MRSRLTQQAGVAVRKLRASKGWTLQQLSEKSGVPLSTLSKLELGQASLTYDKILRICRALDVDPGLSILQQASVPATPSGRRSVIRAGEGEKVALGPHDVRVAASELLSKAFAPMIVTLKAADRVDRRSLPGEVYVYVLEGAAVLHTDVYAPLKLGPGDSVYFDGSTEHALHAASEETTCRALMVVAGDEGFWREGDD